MIVIDTKGWVSAFAGTRIHGVFLIASDTIANINSQLSTIQKTLGSSVSETYRLQGQARPGSQEGHERKVLFSRINIISHK